MAIEDREFRIDGYRFSPKSMLGEFKAFPYQAEEVVVAAPMVPVGQAKVAPPHLRWTLFERTAASIRSGAPWAFPAMGYIWSMLSKSATLPRY